MKKSRLLTGKILLPTLLILVLTTVIVPVEKVSSIPTVTQTSSKTTVYLDPPTINGTVIDEAFTVNIMIRNASPIHNWGIGMIFNPELLECTGFYEGEFLKKDGGSTLPTPGTIDNTAGVITQYGSALLGNLHVNGSGRLAYANFTVKATGVSDLHLRDVVMIKLVSYLPVKVPTNIIDVYTVVVDTTSHTVVTVSNSTGKTGTYHSGFYDHAFNASAEEISFSVTGPYPGFSNVTIPETLLNVSTLYEWIVIIDDLPVSRNAIYNGTHYSIYFAYSKGIHKIQITTRPLISSTITIALSEDSIPLGENVTISGNITAEDHTMRPNAPVTIYLYNTSRLIPRWDTLATVTTDPNGTYSYTWTPETTGTHEVKASWLGDEETLGAISDVLTLTVLKIPSTISITLSSNTITLESNVTISGTIDPWRPAKTVTILYRLSGGTWATLANVTTDQNSNYTYTWTPDEAEAYEVKASWEGDDSTEGAESDALTLTVEKAPEGIPLEIVVVVVVVIIIIAAAIAVYFIKFRKSR